MCYRVRCPVRPAPVPGSAEARHIFWSSRPRLTLYAPIHGCRGPLVEFPAVSIARSHLRYLRFASSWLAAKVHRRFGIRESIPRKAQMGPRGGGGDIIGRRHPIIPVPLCLCVRSQPSKAHRIHAALPVLTPPQPPPRSSTGAVTISGHVRGSARAKAMWMRTSRGGIAFCQSACQPATGEAGR